jgi:hypothetical protein
MINFLDTSTPGKSAKLGDAMFKDNRCGGRRA